MDLKIAKNNENKVTKKNKKNIYNETTDNSYCSATFSIKNLKAIGLEIGRRGTIGCFQVFWKDNILMKFQL